MPRLLAINTSGPTCQVALLLDSQIRELQQPAAMSQGKLILPMLDQLLSEAELSFENLDAIAYVAGPGSFTGLRIAASVVQALSFAFQCPLIALSLPDPTITPEACVLLQLACAQWQRRAFVKPDEALPVYLE